MAELVSYRVPCSICERVVVIAAHSEDMHKWETGKFLIQDVLPYLDADEREILISGICGRCFDRLPRDED